MSKDLRFHLTDEQWQGILFQLRNARIEELEEEVKRLKGEQKPKRCRCGASVRDAGKFSGDTPWFWSPTEAIWADNESGVHLRDERRCPSCGEELKA